MHRWDPVARWPTGLVPPVPVDPTGRLGPTRGQTAGPRWRRTSPGFYVPADTDADVPEQRILEAAPRLPNGAAVTGWAACRVWGAGLIDGLAPDGVTATPVPLALGQSGRIRRAPGTSRHYDRLRPDEVVIRRGVPVTTRLRATWDAMHLAPDDREAVVVLEMMAAARLVPPRWMATYAAARRGRPGTVRIRWAIAHASELSRSPNEVRLRLIWVLDAGLARPLVNCPVHDLAGRLLGIADLLDLEAGLVVEFDGADHRGARRHSRDVDREDLFRRHGLEVVRVTGPDLPARRRVVRRLLAGRARAAFEPVVTRRWVARPVREGALADELEQQRALATANAELAARPAPALSTFDRF